MINSNNLKISSVVAFTKLPNSQCQAVKLQRMPTGYKLHWKYTIEADETESFLEGLSITDLSSTKTGAVLGVDSEGVAFYNIEVPDVDESQLDSIVRMQAEAILPLPIDEMEIAYEQGRVVAGKKNITVSAARKQQIKSYLALAGKFGVGNIILNCQATVKSFDQLFDIGDDKFVILNIRAADSYVLLSDDGKLAGATKLDVGLDGLCESLSGKPSETSELFIHDLRNALDKFNLDKSRETTVYVLSGAFAASEKIAAGLNETGIKAAVTLPRTDVITSDSELTIKDTCVYLDVICVAMMGLDSSQAGKGLFAGVLCAKKKEKKKNPLAALAWSAIFFVIVLAACFYVLIAINKKELACYQNDDIDKLLKKQSYQKLIAQRRPNLLGLMTKISDGTPSGTTFNSISFKKGQTVVITGQASKLDDIIKLQNFLVNKKGFSDVKFQKPKLDAKEKKLSFKMDMHYTGSGQRWTRKGVK